MWEGYDANSVLVVRRVLRVCVVPAPQLLVAQIKAPIL